MGDDPQPRFGSVGEFVAGQEVLTFFALALAVSWAVWVPAALSVVDYGSLILGAIVVGGFGPLVAAATVTWLVGGSLRPWAEQVFRWRVSPRWYLFAFGVPLLLIATTGAVYVVLGNPSPFAQARTAQQIPLSALPVVYVLSMVFVFLLGGGQEELGWRGFALPRLLDRFDAVTASLVIGAVWAIWHLPLFMLEGSSQYGASFAPYATTLLALSVPFTLLYRGTGQSVLLAMLLHASYNSSFVLLPAESALDTLTWIMAAASVVLALGLIAVYGDDL